MFKVSKFVKNIAIVVASLALIVPLASVNNVASAHSKRSHYRVARVMKRHAKRNHKHFKRMRMGAVNSYDLKVSKALNKESKNASYNAGFNDALHAKVNRKLVNNLNYEKGYLQIVALDNYTDPSGKNVPTQLSNSALKSAQVYYNHCVK